MPSAWTAAALTFQGSFDGTTYADLYSSAGTEENYTVSTSRTVYVDPTRFDCRFLKVRSGTAGAPVTQAAARTITLLLVP